MDKLMSREEIEGHVSDIEKAFATQGPNVTLLIEMSELERLCLTALEGLENYDKAIEDAAQVAENEQPQRNLYPQDSQYQRVADRIRQLKGTSNG